MCMYQVFYSRFRICWNYSLCTWNTEDKSYVLRFMSENFLKIPFVCLHFTKKKEISMRRGTKDQLLTDFSKILVVQEEKHF